MAILLTVLIFIASSFSSRFMSCMTTCHPPSPPLFLCDPCYCSVSNSVDSDTPFKMSLWGQGTPVLHTLELRHRGWKIHPMQCKKFMSAGHSPVLIRGFLSSLSRDQFTVNHKTHPMKQIPGIWNWVPLGSFNLYKLPELVVFWHVKI